MIDHDLIPPRMLSPGHWSDQTGLTMTRFLKISYSYIILGLGYKYFDINIWRPHWIYPGADQAWSTRSTLRPDCSPPSRTPSGKVLKIWQGLLPNKLFFYNCPSWPEIGGGLNTMFTAGVFKQKYISLSFPTFPSVSESAVSRQRLNLPLEYSTSASSADADCSNTALWAFPLLFSPKIVSLTLDVGQKRKQCMLLTYQQTWLGRRL